MTILTEGKRTAEFIISEANAWRSRDEVTVLVGVTALKAGQILGMVTSGAATAAAQAGNTGNATSSAVTTGANVQPGAYTVEFITATTFSVVDPDGNTIGNGRTGTAFAEGAEVLFTITAGATAMVSGDGFIITVATGSNKYVPQVAAALDGSSVPAAILYSDLAASYDGPATVLIRDSEVSGSDLTYDPAADAAAITAANVALAALGIIVR